MWNPARFAATVVVAFAFGHSAMAGDPPAETETEAATTEAAATPAAQEEEMPNCAELEGDELTACEAKVKELMAAKEAEATEETTEKASKGGKAARSNTNRMESEFTDE